DPQGRASGLEPGGVPRTAAETPVAVASCTISADGRSQEGWRRKRSDQVAQDRRLAEDRRGAQSAHGGGGMFAQREYAAAGGLMAYSADFLGSVPPSGHLRGQDPEGRQARRPPDRAADEVGVRRQPQDRKGARPDDPTIATWCERIRSLNDRKPRRYFHRNRDTTGARDGDLPKRLFSCCARS